MSRRRTATCPATASRSSLRSICAHKYGQKDEPLRLGTLNERDEAPSGGINASLRTIYGIMHGLVDDRLTNSNETRHLTVRSVTG